MIALTVITLRDAECINNVAVVLNVLLCSVFYFDCCAIWRRFSRYGLLLQHRPWKFEVQREDDRPLVDCLLDFGVVPWRIRLVSGEKDLACTEWVGFTFIIRCENKLFISFIDLYESTKLVVREPTSHSCWGLQVRSHLAIVTCAVIPPMGGWILWTVGL